MNTGISLYFSNGIEKNMVILDRAIRNKVKYAFTSLHIPEETGVDYHLDIQKLLAKCREGNLQLIVDVGPETLEKLGVKKIDELEDMGITHVRLDYGFSAEETVQISEKFHVVFNASTISEKDIMSWKKTGADFTRFAACHNYYPKQFTALSVEKVKEINLRLKYLGFTTMAFVPGNLEMRGPLYEGLPTVEAHRERKEEVLLNMLELFYEGCCDVVLIGDVDVEEKEWKAVGCLSCDYVELKADIIPKYEFVKELIHHDRPDSSQYVIRSQESRNYSQEILPDTVRQETAGGDDRESGSAITARKMGSISISNKKYLRYMGELEIARMDLPEEERVNVIGQVTKTDEKYLPYIRNGLGFKLI